MKTMRRKRPSAPERWLRVIALSAATLLTACSSDDTATKLDSEPSLSVSLPDFLLSADFVTQNDIDTGVIKPVVTLPNGVTVSMNIDGDNRWSGKVTVKTDNVYAVNVTWVEQFRGRDLPLTRLSLLLAVDKDGSAEQSDRTGYRREPDDALDADLDADNDGLSNFTERSNGTDPLISNEEPPDSNSDSFSDGLALLPLTADVIIPRISPDEAPLIDGRTVAPNGQNQLKGEWANAVQTDISGASLTIDHLLVDANAEATNSSPYRQWAAMHDGIYLYLAVMVDDHGRRFHDSGTLLSDDASLELFLDADNSKSQLSDETEFHHVFSLEQADLQASGRRITSADVMGKNSSARPMAIDFATGLVDMDPDGLRDTNNKQGIYEIRIPLDSAKISSDAPFGLELQINDNGTGRVSKWAWKYSAKAENDVDGTAANPSRMGTVMLE